MLIRKRSFLYDSFGGPSRVKWHEAWVRGWVNYTDVITSIHDDFNVYNAGGEL